MSFTGFRGHLLRVMVRGHIAIAPSPARLTWYPQAICLGLVHTGGTIRAEEFTVLTPRGISLKFPTVSSNFLRVARLKGEGGKPVIDELGRTAHVFVVEFSKPPAGMVREKITIGVTDKYVPEIVIPITGRIERPASLVHKATQ